VEWASPRAAAEVTRSLRETGFAVLSGAAIDDATLRRVRTEWTAFFAGDAKNAYRAGPDTSDGYVPFTAADEVAGRDRKEYFHVRPGGRYPSEVSGAALDHLRTAVAVATTVLGWVQAHTPAAVSRSLPQPLDAMARGGAASVLRIQHYLPLPPGAPASAIRAKEHSDINLITVLPAPMEPGLQVRGTDGCWHDIPAGPGRVIINTGEVLSALCGGHYPATPHRVLAPPDAGTRSRLSFPLFVHPPAELPMGPGETVAGFVARRVAELRSGGWRPGIG
jgi:isopenicillin N synthase-like dioxygenase